MQNARDTASAASLNRAFLEAAEPEARGMILNAIAKHYGVSSTQIYAEVISEGAEHLLEYMIEPHRSATLALMQHRGFANPKTND